MVANRPRIQWLATDCEPLEPEQIESPSGPYHDFWLLREAECPYHETEQYWGRENAPVRLPIDLMEYFCDSLSWLPVMSPGRRKHIPGLGLHLYGPNIINQEGELRFSGLFRAWAEHFSQGPDPLLLQIGISYRWTRMMVR